MTSMEKEQMIHDAVQMCFDAGIEPELQPISDFLAAQGHKYSRAFLFIFCVACDVGKMRRKAHASIEA